MSGPLTGVVIIGLVGVAIGVTLVLHRMHPTIIGWTRLAQRYAFTGHFAGRVISCAGRMGFAVTREPWLVEVGSMPEGLYLRNSRMLGSGDPAALVPWRELAIANRHLVAFSLLTVYIGPERRQLDLRAGFDKAFESELLAHYDAGKGTVRVST